MRALACALLCMTTIASADAPRKTNPDKYAKAAHDAFARATAAEDANQLNTAIEQYQRAFDISPHPATVFNLAEVQARTGRWTDALVNYELYLVLAPDAPDRKAVEKLIAQALQSTVDVEVDVPGADARDTIPLDEAYVLLDGAIVAKPGTVKAKVHGDHLAFVVPMTEGHHVVDIVTPLTYATKSTDVQHGRINDVELRAPPRIDGSVVIRVDDLDLVTSLSENIDDSGIRIPLSGKRTFGLSDKYYECPPLTVEGKPGNNVTYVYVGPSDLRHRYFQSSPVHCRKLAIKQLTLVFAP